MSERKTTEDRLGRDPSAELRAAVASLDGTEVWLDDNNPWRIMLVRDRFNIAVAEAHPENAPDDGAWKDGAAICAIVNEAIVFCEAKRKAEAPINSTMVSALKAMDAALVYEWSAPEDEYTRRNMPGTARLAWIQIRSAISQADGR